MKKLLLLIALMFGSIIYGQTKEELNCLAFIKTIHEKGKALNIFDKPKNIAGKTDILFYWGNNYYIYLDWKTSERFSFTLISLPSLSYWDNFVKAAKTNYSQAVKDILHYVVCDYDEPHRK